MKYNIDELLVSAEINLTDEVPVNQPIIRVGGEPIATVGNISATIGKAKAKKSFNLLAMAAATILFNEGVLEYIGHLPPGKARILYIDTEQSTGHCILAFKRLAKMGKLPLDVKPENIIFLGLRRFSTQQRVELIERAIEKYEGLGLVLIDGIRDLVNDVNDSSQANWIISKFMQWSENYNIHCHVILHQNKGDSNARGHLGTELVNKCETVIEIVRDGDSQRSIVRPLFCRNKEFDPFSFYINDEGLPELAEEGMSIGLGTGAKFSYEELTVTQHQEALSDVFKDSDEIAYGLLINKLKESYGRYFKNGLGDNKVKALKSFLENKRMIIKEGGKNYRYNQDFVF